MNKLQFSVCMVLIFCLCYSCVGSAGTAPKLSANDVRSIFPPDTASYFGATNLKINSNELMIIIDGSHSMSGFNNSAGTTIFSKFLENMLTLALVGYEKKFYRLDGDNCRLQTESEIWNARIRDTFFQSAETRLGGLVHGIANLPDDQLCRGYVIITDGVESTIQNPGGGSISDYTLLVREMNRLQAERGFSTRMIGIKSEFYGKAYSEYNRFTGDGPHKLNTYNSEIYADGNRPFYVYILSPHPSTANELMNHFRNMQLIKDLGKENSYFVNLSQDLCKHYQLDFTVNPEVYTGVKNPLQINKLPDKTDFDIVWTRWKPSGGARYRCCKLHSIISAIFAPEAQDMLDKFDYVKIDIEGAYLNGDSVEYFDARDCIRYDIESPENAPAQGTIEKKYDLEIEITPWEKIGTYVYHFKVRMDPNNIQAPPMVTGWSCSDDSKIESYNKTFNLEPLVRSLLRNKRVTSQIISDFYVVMEKRN